MIEYKQVKSSLFKVYTIPEHLAKIVVMSIKSISNPSQTPSFRPCAPLCSVHDNCTGVLGAPFQEDQAPSPIRPRAQRATSAPSVHASSPFRRLICRWRHLRLKQLPVCRAVRKSYGTVRPGQSATGWPPAS